MSELEKNLLKYIADLEADTLVSMAEYANNQRVIADLKQLIAKCTKLVH
jgi:hypothetical protein